MKVGDLVRYWHDTDRTPKPTGIIVGFDVDGDPIVSFIESATPDEGMPYFRHDIEIINENW